MTGNLSRCFFILTILLFQLVLAHVHAQTGSKIKRYIIDEVKSNHSFIRQSLEKRNWTELKTHRYVHDEENWIVMGHARERLGSYLDNKENFERHMRKIAEVNERAKEHTPETYLIGNLEEEEGIEEWKDFLNVFEKKKGRCRSNAWKDCLYILKPASLAKGIGITIHTSPYSIEKEVRAKNQCYILQKYLVDAFLVEGHKFDIRQFVLVTSIKPKKVFIFSDSYLRFSVSQYEKKQTDIDQWIEDKFVHLTNHQIQKDHENITSFGLASGAQWTQKRFKNILNEHHDVEYDTEIQPRIKQMLQDVFQRLPLYFHRENSFELLGVDIMLDTSLHPWIIEINSSPGLHALTDVVKSHHSRAIEGMIKIVLGEGHQGSGWDPIIMEKDSRTGYGRIGSLRKTKQEQIPST